MYKSFYSIKFVVSLITSFCILCSCNTQEKQNKDQYIQLTDGLNRIIKIPVNPQRVISLCPSQTECLLEIIDTSQLVGVTTVCDFPFEKIKNKNRINSYPIDFEKLLILKPDLVVSLKGMISPDAIKKMESLQIPLLIQNADSLENIAKNFEQLGFIFNKIEKAKIVANKIRTIKSALSTNSKKTFLFLFSTEPLYAFGEGNFLNEVFVSNGFINIANLEETKVPYPILSREYILKKNPDYLFITDTNHLAYLEKKYAEFKNLKCIKNNNIKVINPDICSRPTLRVLQIDSLLKKY